MSMHPHDGRYGDLLVVAPETLWPQLEQGLLPTVCRIRFAPRSCLHGAASDPYGLADLIASQKKRPDGLLLVAPHESRVEQVVPKSVIGGVPVGIVRADRAAHLEAWLGGVCQTRACVKPPVWATLAMGKDLYLNFGRKVHATLQAGSARYGTTTKNWHADVITRDKLCQRLTTGPQLAIYMGHGRSRGWSGYQAVRWEHIAATDVQRPCGTIVSFACDTLQCADDTVSFGYQWIATGRAAAYFGTTIAMKVAPGMRLASIFADRLSQFRFQTIGELMVSVDEHVNASHTLAAAKDELDAFRLVGFPLQRLGLWQRTRTHPQLATLPNALAASAIRSNG